MNQRVLDGVVRRVLAARDPMPLYVLPPTIAACIDHTLLKAEATGEQVRALAAEARGLGMAAVCVNSSWVPVAAEVLQGSPVRVAAVVGFPLGAGSTRAKAAETRIAVGDGATEIDMVISLGAVKAADWKAVGRDIREVVKAARGAAVKAILETAALTPQEIIRAAAVAKAAGVAFVKTSTGFHPAGGANEEAVGLMRRTVGSEIGVKASGGIRSADAALSMLAAGANRLGTSSGVVIVEALADDTRDLAELVRAAAGSRHVEAGELRVGSSR